MSHPLIVSVLLDEATQSRLDALRRAHFPPSRNHLDAHVTLFHALPGDEEPAVTAALRAATARDPLPATVSRVRSLGRGVAYVVDCPGVLALRRELAAEWDPWLTAQDRGKHELHATVQNKVSPDAARALLARLGAGFAPYPATATGLGLWRYLGGPWEPVRTFRFDGGGELCPGASS